MLVVSLSNQVVQSLVDMATSWCFEATTQHCTAQDRTGQDRTGQDRGWLAGTLHTQTSHLGLPDERALLVV